MGMFSKIVLGSLAFLAGAAFMADENERKRNQQPWKRLPNDPLPNADKAPITPNPKEWLDKNADLDEETKRALCNDFIKVMEEWNRKKAAVPQQSAQPSSIPQQQLSKFPIYGPEPQKGQWSQGANFEQARQIGVLEVYRDSIRDLVDMPEFKDFKLDKETIKKFVKNEFVKAFLKAHLAHTGTDADSVQPTTPPSATANPAPATNPTEQTGPSGGSVANTAATNSDTAEHRDSSVISITSGPIGFDDLTDPLKKG